MATKNNQYIDGRKVVDGTTLTLTEWLQKLDDPTMLLSPTVAFPTDEMRDEYLQTISERSPEEVIHLIRHFVITTCTTELDKTVFDALPRSGITPPNERFRRMLYLGPAWEGLTWVIDLLEISPQRAIDVLDAYAETHIQALDRGWWGERLYDAIALIRAKWIETEHPEDLFISLGDKKFERLVSNLYSKIGYRTSLTQASHDGGVDIRASWERAGQRHGALIQCKCVSKNVGVRVVRELHGTVEDAKVSKGILVCTQFFTPAAKKWAANNPRLELIDRMTLMHLLNAHFGITWTHRIDYYTSLAPTISVDGEDTDT